MHRWEPGFSCYSTVPVIRRYTIWHLVYHVVRFRVSFWMMWQSGVAVSSGGSGVLRLGVRGLAVATGCHTFAHLLLPAIDTLGPLCAVHQVERFDALGKSCYNCTTDMRRTCEGVKSRGHYFV